jgi:RNA polymerase sigma-70 factor (ECF subfamily)
VEPPSGPMPLSTITLAIPVDRSTDRGSSNAVADAAMDRYAAGDMSAFSPLYDAIAPRLYAYLLRQTRDRALSEDILQQTLFQMHDARASFVPGSRVVPWSFAIARRIVIDRARRAKREVLRDHDEAERDEIASHDVSADEAIETRELAEHVERELSRLPPQQRVAFALVKEDGLTLVEAAEVLGTTVGAVKLRVHRAYDAIRTAIGGVRASKGRQP